MRGSGRGGQDGDRREGEWYLPTFGEKVTTLAETEIMGWQWHQLDHILVICTSLQAHNHTSTSLLVFKARRHKHWRHISHLNKAKFHIYQLRWSVAVGQ